MKAKQVLILPNNGGIMTQPQRDDKPWVDDEDDTDIDEQYEAIWRNQALLDETKWISKLIACDE